MNKKLTGRQKFEDLKEQVKSKYNSGAGFNYGEIERFTEVRILTDRSLLFDIDIAFIEAPLLVTKDWEILQKYREWFFEKFELRFRDSRKNIGVETTEYDVVEFYKVLLNNELAVMDEWLTNKRADGKEKLAKQSLSNKIEIGKYKEYIKDRLKALEGGDISESIDMQSELQENITISPNSNAIEGYYSFNRKNNNYMHDYLLNLKVVFNIQNTEIKNKTFGGICWVLHDRRLFDIKKFSRLMETLASYWGINTPKDKRPSKYKTTGEELRRKYSILDRVIL